MLREPIGLNNGKLLEMDVVLMLIRDPGTRNQTRDMVCVIEMSSITRDEAHLEVASLTKQQSQYEAFRYRASVFDLYLPTQDDIKEYLGQKIRSQEVVPSV